jgi:hypothetical protein
MSPLPVWQAAFGPDWKRIQQTWLHTLGNLTLRPRRTSSTWCRLSLNLPFSEIHDPKKRCTGAASP